MGTLLFIVAFIVLSTLSADHMHRWALGRSGRNASMMLDQVIDRTAMLHTLSNLSSISNNGGRNSLLPPFIIVANKGVGLCSKKYLEINEHKAFRGERL